MALATYYSSLMALTLFYLVASFSAELPWATCQEDWGDACTDSSTKLNRTVDSTNSIESAETLGGLFNGGVQRQSSAELYFS